MPHLTADFATVINSEGENMIFEKQVTDMFRKIASKRRNRGEKTEMIELAKRFVNKECIIYAFNSQIEGVVKEVSDGAILVENKGTLEAINLDFVTRIREYPKKKNGKKKSVVLD